MLIDVVRGARIEGHDGDRDLHLQGGRVTGVTPARALGHSGTTLSAAGRAVLPAFVDAHVHLDKAFLLDRTGPTAPRLETAIQVVGAVREAAGTLGVAENAERAVHLLIRRGVTAARAHVEIDPAIGLEFVGLHRTLAERARDRIELQLVAFPQRGLELAGMQELMTRAMAEGIHVVGGCPYVDSDPRRHLDFVFGLAEKHDAPIDLHLDFSDDPDRSLLGLVAERVHAHGVVGKVTIGHVTTLAAMGADEQARALELLASADIAVVLLPATDLYLAGHGEPGTRSLAPIERARRAGVRVAIANNNLNNPFAAFGNADLVQAAWLTGVVRRTSDEEGRAFLLDAITREPAKILGLPPHGPDEGKAAHLAVLDAERPEDVVLFAPAVLATLRAGKLVHRLAVPAVDVGV